MHIPGFSFVKTGDGFCLDDGLFASRFPELVLQDVLGHTLHLVLLPITG